ncbi:secreted RxLR effector protein 161-like [Vigna angularis]|uniref:secreted RxLR effector protein 161-like n=1 Tax=Phaseolus angularis TaxID=3914 RepID=UPI0022B41346|nr:secreted RxLR effector protein 161-like [Vigna angularis]
MEGCNSANVPVLANTKLSIQADDKKADATLFKQIVGSLRYVCNSRPDISYCVGLVSRFMSDPRQSHLSTAKHILPYLKGTIDFGLCFPKKTDRMTGVLKAWSDSDWCGDQKDRKSTFGYVIKYMGAWFSCCSKKQSVVALSSCKAEYIASAKTACQCAWLETILDELKIECCKPIQLLIDNRSVINLSKNPISHGRSKHIRPNFII